MDFLRCFLAAIFMVEVTTSLGSVHSWGTLVGGTHIGRNLEGVPEKFRHWLETATKKMHAQLGGD